MSHQESMKRIGFLSILGWIQKPSTTHQYSLSILFISVLPSISLICIWYNRLFRSALSMKSKEISQETKKKKKIWVFLFKMNSSFLLDFHPFLCKDSFFPKHPNSNEIPRNFWDRKTRNELGFRSLSWIQGLMKIRRKKSMPWIGFLAWDLNTFARKGTKCRERGF